MADQKLTAVEACREISKALKKQLQENKKPVLSPHDAGLKIAKSTLNAIKEYAEQLEKMQAKESGEPLSKAAPSWVNMGMIDDQYKAHEAADHPYTIHHDTKATSPTRKFALKHNDDGHLSWHGTLGDAKKAAQKHIAGGIGKSDEAMDVTHKESAVKEAPADKHPAPVPAKKKFTKSVFDFNKRSKLETANNPTDLEMVKPQERDSKDALLPTDKDPVKQDEPKQGSGGQTRPTKKMMKSESSVLTKSFKSHAQKMMAQHANIAGSLQESKNKKMPATQQSMKLPSMSQHAGRAAGFSDFMPSGKFNKADLMKDMEKMDCLMTKTPMKKAGVLGTGSNDASRAGVTMVNSNKATGVSGSNNGIFMD
jgi:hypothetical protein